MDKDILDKLRTPLKYIEIDGVTVETHPDGPIEDLLEEAADAIAELRAKLG